MAFDITFQTNGDPTCTEVECRVTLSIPIERSVIPLTFVAGNQYAAYLLAEHMQKCLEDAVERAHRLAYNRGWDDHRKKCRKATVFSAWFELGQDRVAD